MKRIDRTPSLGLWHFGEQFYKAGLLAAQSPTLGEVSVTLYLICHSIELTLKAFLRGKGKRVPELIRIGHDLEALLAAADKDGLSSICSLPAKSRDDIRLVNQYYKLKDFEYMFGGVQTLPRIERLIEIANLLLAQTKGFCIQTAALHENQPTAWPEPTGPQVYVLIGNSNVDSFNQIFLDIIRTELGETRTVAATHAGTYSEIMKAIVGDQFDLCIVILNNIPDLPNRSVDGMASFVALLKQTSSSPIIALAGWPDDRSLDERVLQAGAAAFFRLPFVVREFQKAVATCLSDATSAGHQLKPSRSGTGVRGTGVNGTGVNS